MRHITLDMTLVTFPANRFKTLLNKKADSRRLFCCGELAFLFEDQPLFAGHAFSAGGEQVDAAGEGSDIETMGIGAGS